MEEESNENVLILVGFGKHDLDEVLSWRGTPRERDALVAPKKWPPRYRRKGICTQDDQERHIEYVEWISTTGYSDLTF